jgi:Tfp pilus assembly protein PilO
MLNREPDYVLKILGRQMDIAGGIITAVIVMAVACLHWGPLNRDADDSIQRLVALHVLLGDERHVRADHARLRRQLDEALIEEAAIQKRIPREPQEAEFLAQISEAAGKVGLQIADYRPGVMVAGKVTSTLRVELACEGDYRAICTLLDRLQQLPRYSTVARLEIGPGNSSERHLAKLCLELYFFNDGRKVAAR